MITTYNTHIRKTHTHTTTNNMHNRAVKTLEMKGVGHGLGTITSDRGRAAGRLRGSNTNLQVGPLAAAAAEAAQPVAEIPAVPPAAAEVGEEEEEAEEAQVVESAAAAESALVEEDKVAEMGPIAGAARGVVQIRLSVRGTRQGKQPQNIPGERVKHGGNDVTVAHDRRVVTQPGSGDMMRNACER